MADISRRGARWMSHATAASAASRILQPHCSLSLSPTHSHSHPSGRPVGGWSKLFDPPCIPQGGSKSFRPSAVARQMTCVDGSHVSSPYSAPCNSAALHGSPHSHTHKLIYMSATFQAAAAWRLWKQQKRARRESLIAAVDSIEAPRRTPYFRTAEGEHGSDV